MAGISYFSSRSYPLGPLSRSEYSRSIGSIAHLMEYAGLAVLLFRALSGGWPNKELVAPDQSGLLAHKSTFVYSFLIGLLFAFLDEFHQGFVPGRDAKLSDVALDTIGVSMALTVIGGWLGLRREKPADREAEESEDGG